MAVVSILGSAPCPRAKFLEIMVLNILGVCLATAFGLLTAYASVKARQNTAPYTGQEGCCTPEVALVEVPYNGPASAVSGSFLFLQIWLIHSWRARYPRLQTPVIIYAIFVNLLAISSPRFVSMHAAKSTLVHLLKTFLSGLAIATATSLFVFPSTCRDTFFSIMSSYIQEIRTAVKVRFRNVDHLESECTCGNIGPRSCDCLFQRSAEHLRSIHGQLTGELPFAKREVALGRLDAKDLQTMYFRLRDVMIATVGLSVSMNNYNSSAQGHPISTQGHEFEALGASNGDKIDQGVAPLIQLIDEGLQHTLITLKKNNIGARDHNIHADVENSQYGHSPGSFGFSLYFDMRMQALIEEKQAKSQHWDMDNNENSHINTEGLLQRELDARENDSRPHPKISTCVCGFMCL